MPVISDSTIASLHNRVFDLLDRTRTLEPADKATIARELAVPEKAVEETFAQLLTVVDRAVDVHEIMKARTEKLRHSAGDGVGSQFQGQKSGSAASSPALRGTNLTVPGDAARTWRKLVKDLDAIVAQVKSGALAGPALERAVQALPQPDAATTAFLWSPAGEALRTALNKSNTELASLAPNAVVAVVNGKDITARMNSLHSAIIEAQRNHDHDGAAATARIFATDYPDADLAVWARGVADMTGGIAVRNPGWPDRQMKAGSYELPSGTSLEVMGSELHVALPPGVDTQALEAAGFTFYGGTGKLVPPTGGNAYREGRYALPGGGSLVVGANNAIAVAAPAGQEQAWSAALAGQGFRASDAGLDVPRAASSYWPTWQPVDMSIGDGTSMHRAAQSLSFGIPPGMADDMKKRGFAVTSGGRATPPLNRDGAMVPGDYVLPNNVRLVVGKDNAFSLDLARLVDFAYDQTAPALEAAGFAKDGTVFT
ncbi:MAG TPA: hypothetical protein VGO62_12675, partial [Myxococcota bacterium]